MEKSILPPNEPGWLDEQFSVVQGFDIATLFFTFLWPSLEAKFPEMPENDVDVYEIFSAVCMGFETSAEWNKAIYRLKKIRKEEQREIKLSSRDLFLCSIEICKIQNARFVEGTLAYLINLLEEMLTHPENHSFEWSIWQQSVKESFTRPYHPFSWLHDLREPETEDTP